MLKASSTVTVDPAVSGVVLGGVIATVPLVPAVITVVPDIVPDCPFIEAPTTVIVVAPWFWTTIVQIVLVLDVLG
ncbi:MAG: hypothetical protein QW613_05640, partial [Thermoprotei archaeon]